MKIFDSMKKFIMILGAFALSLVSFVSCEKEDVVEFYYYSNAFYLTKDSDVSAIETVLESKLNVLYELTPAQAQAEWENFIKSVDDSKVILCEGDYYTVVFQRMVEVGDRMEPAETIGQKTWQPSAR